MEKERALHGQHLMAIFHRRSRLWMEFLPERSLGSRNFCIPADRPLRADQADLLPFPLGRQVVVLGLSGGHKTYLSFKTDLLPGAVMT